MASYRVLLADFQSNVVIDEVFPETFSYEEVINAPGSFTGRFDMRDPKLTTASLYPWRNAIYIERNKQIQWGGVVTSVAPNTNEGTLDVSAKGLFAYTRKRTLNVTKTYAAQDQTSGITADLLSYMMTIYPVSWDLDIQPSGVLRDRTTYYGYERRTIFELITQLSQVQNGFDFVVKPSWDGDEIVPVFRTFYPQRGRRTGYAWRKFVDGTPGSNVMSIAGALDGEGLANTVHAIGDGDGESMRQTTSADLTAIGETKFPLLETVTKHKTVRHSSTLQLHSDADLVTYRSVPHTIEIELRRGHPQTQVGSFEPGDELTVIAQDGWLQLDGLWKVISYKVAVDEVRSESVSARATKVY